MKEKIIIIFFFLSIINLFSCSKNDNPIPDNIDFRQEMRTFVQEISSYSKNINSKFEIITQNGVEIISKSNSPDINYINAIDGIGQESLFYGYGADDKASPNDMIEWTSSFLEMAKNNGTVKIIVTDYCSTTSKMDNSFAENNIKNYISFAANHRALDNIPDYPTTIYNENSNDITNIQEAKNFLYLINPDNQYASKQEFVNAIANTNYDFVIMDYFYANEEFTSTQIEELKQKQNGGKRLLICYMSIGEAEEYRYYWNEEWSNKPPVWLDKENPQWKGNYKVRYWEQDWKNIIYGNNNSYLKKIIDSGFDGVYLDIIDAFEYFENL